MQEGRARRVVTNLVIAALVVSVIALLVFVPGFRAAVVSVLNWLVSQGLGALGAFWRVLAPIVGAVILAGVITLTVYLVARSRSRSIPIPVGITVFLIAFVATIPGIAGATVSASLGLAAGVLAALIALLGVIFAQSLNAYSAWITQRRELASAREDTLQSCLDTIKEVLGESQPDQELTDDHKRAIVRAKFRAALLRLDGDGKGILLRFLHEMGSIKKSRTENGNLPPEGLHGADLSQANLRFVDLSDSDLRGVNLRSADLRDADLTGTDLSKADLSSDLLRADNRTIFAPVVAKVVSIIESDASLSRVNRRSTDLSGADLSKADLSNTDLRGANLKGVKGVIREQIGQALNVTPEQIEQATRTSQEQREQESVSQSTKSAVKEAVIVRVKDPPTSQ